MYKERLDFILITVYKMAFLRFQYESIGRQWKPGWRTTSNLCATESNDGWR